MKNPLPKLALPLLLSVSALSGCSQLSELMPVDAAAEAARAQNAYQLGDYAEAKRHIKLALSKSDDVSEYWLTAGRIGIATGDNGFTYNAYQNALSLDRGNVEALQALCQVGPAIASADEVDRYADQLLLLQPTSPLALTAKGNSALRRGDTAAADAFATRILGNDPQSARGLVLKAQVLVRQKRRGEAGPLLEDALKAVSSNDSPALLELLVKLYRAEQNRAGYESAAARLANAVPDKLDAQLRYADILYENGQADAAYARILDIMRRHPHEIGAQQAILELWLTQGRTALQLERIATDAAGVSLLMRVAFAAYANAMGHPEIARKLLVLDAAKKGTSPAELDAKAVYGEALAMSGDIAKGTELIGQVLAVDPRQPKALLARARIELAGGNSDAALTDARQLITGDTDYVTAQLLLADILERRGEKQLEESALREALAASPGDPRLTQRLALQLIGEQHGAEAADLLKDALGAAPVSQRLTRLRNALCPRTGIATCNARLELSQINSLD